MARRSPSRLPSQTLEGVGPQSTNAGPITIGAPGRRDLFASHEEDRSFTEGRVRRTREQWRSDQDLHSDVHVDRCRRTEGKELARSVPYGDRGTTGTTYTCILEATNSRSMGLPRSHVPWRISAPPGIAVACVSGIRRARNGPVAGLTCARRTRSGSSTWCPTRRNAISVSTVAGTSGETPTVRPDSTWS